MKRKLLSVLLMLCLAFSLLPTAALADGEGTPALAEVPAAAGTALPAAVDGVITLENGTYVMSEDTTATIKVPNGKNATLDLNGKTLTNKTGEHTIIVENGATLTITGNGIVDNVSHEKAAVYNEGTVTLAGGTFKRSQDAGTASPNNANGNSWYTVKNFGTMVINSGVTIENKGSFSSAIANGWYDVTKSGNGSEPAHSADAVLTINGGNISGGKITVKNDDGGKLTINDGTFTQSESNLFCIYNANVAKITGGTINGCVGSIESNPSSEYNKGEFTISGGTFNTDVSEFVADGYILNNGTVETLGETNAVAKVGDTYYKTLPEAIAAAKDGETVILLSDRKNYVTNTINANITIDLNGKTLSVGNNNPFFRTNGEVTIQNGTITSDSACVIVNAYNKLTLKNVKITGVTGGSGKNLVNVCSNAEVTIDKDTVLTASGSDGAAVFIGQDADAKYTLNVYGKVIRESKSFAISGNGSYKGTTTINIYDGAEVKSASVAIYHPQAGVINVYGGLVEGYCAIGIKSGTLNINGGTVRGTADDHALNDSNSVNGTIMYDGSAIVVDSRATGYAGNVKINVTGGTVESYYSTAIREIGEQDKPNMTQLTELKVTGGEVLGASKNLGNVTNDMLVRDISVKNVSVSGGTFSSDPSVYVVGNGNTNIVKRAGSEGAYTYTVLAKSGLTSGVYLTDPSGALASNYYVSSTANGVWTVSYSAPYSGGSSSYDPTYSVSTPSKTEHGTVTVSPKSASKGDRVTVTVKPDSGYVLETLTVTDKNGNELTLKDKGNGKYTFTMPAGKVEVKATFMEDNSMLNFFYDVPNNAYFYEAVKWAVENGITTGVGNDLFAPEQPCTRAQIVTFLWRAAGSPEPKGAASGMTDVVSGSYYEKAVAWAIENGITTGTTTSTFSPDATCTRAQAVTFLARALKAKAASAAEFSDVPTGSYFADAVAWAAANGVTEGIGGGLFGSDNDCTRGQIVTFLYRAYNK